MKRKFLDLLKNTSDYTRVCVGIDPRIGAILDKYKSSGPTISDVNTDAETLEYFSIAIMEETSSSAAAFKFNLAFFEAVKDGERALINILQHAKSNFPHVGLIGDSKNADIGNTNELYYEKIFVRYGFDAMTTNPYMGEPEKLNQLVMENEKFLIPVLLTSNPEAAKVQMQILKDGRFLYEEVGRQISQEWLCREHCGVVIGATKSEDEFKKACGVSENRFALVPGVGAQGGSLQMCVKNLYGRLYLVNSSREIIYSDKPGMAAENLRLEINTLDAAEKEFRAQSVH